MLKILPRPTSNPLNKYLQVQFANFNPPLSKNNLNEEGQTDTQLMSLLTRSSQVHEFKSSLVHVL